MIHGEASDDEQTTKPGAKLTRFIPIQFVSKMTAAYLLKKKAASDSKELVLTQADIFNWLVQGNYNQYFNCSAYYFQYEENGKNKKVIIFEKFTVGNKQQNFVKYTFSKEWIKHFDVIEESKLDKWLKKNKKNPNRHFYSDGRSTKALQKDRRYR